MHGGQGILRFGVFTFDPTTRTLWKDKTVVPLQDHPAKILGLLLEAPGQIVTRERIQSELWPNDAYGEFTAGVNTAVSKLRSALHDSASRPIYIETIPRSGYRFAAPLQLAGHSAPAAEIPAAQPLNQPQFSIHRLTAIGAAAVIAFAAIAFTAWKMGAFHRPLENLQWASHPLTTFSGSVNRPLFSPDGKSVSFDWDGPNRDNTDIYLLQIGADTPIRLTTDPAEENWGVFAPDGSRMAFLRHSEETSASIFMMPLPGSAERFFAKIPRARDERPRLDWSSDGAYLVTNPRDRLGEPSYLVRIDSQTASMHRLTSPVAKTLGDSEAVFSPDGRQIAFRRTLSSGVEDAYIISVSGGEPRRVTFDNRGISSIAWTSNATALLVSSLRRGSTREIWRFPLDGGKPERLTSPALDAGEQAVSRDGSRVVFVQSAVDTNVYEYPLPPGNTGRRVADSTRIDGGPVYSADGSKFAFRSTRTGAEEFWISARDGANPRRLTSLGGPAVGGIRWSKDGKRLTFDTRIEPNSDCFLIDADGANLTRFHNEPTNESSPSFSGDNKYLYFASNRSGSAEIWRQPLAGGAAIQLTVGGGNQAIEAPDGKTLYYARRNHAAILALPLTGPFPAEGKPLVTLENGAYGKWSVTPSGIYYLETDKTFPEPLRLRFLPHLGGPPRDAGPMPRQARVVDGNLSVSPDEKTILIGLLDRSGSGLVLADLK